MKQTVGSILNEFKEADKGEVVDVSLLRDSITTTFKKGYAIRQTEDGISFIFPYHAN